MQQQSLVSLRLVCDGSRVEAGSSLERNKTLRSVCTLSATLVSQGVACLQDGKHEASYEGRNEHRVVYRIGAVIMKLCVDTSNQLKLRVSNEHEILNRLHACSLKGNAL